MNSFFRCIKCMSTRTCEAAIKKRIHAVYQSCKVTTEDENQHWNQAEKLGFFYASVHTKGREGF